MTSHSGRASPRGATTASVDCTNGLTKNGRNATGTSSRSSHVVAGRT